MLTGLEFYEDYKRLVFVIVFRLFRSNFQVRKLGMEDARQVGMLGLLKAAQQWRTSEERGDKSHASFATYAWTAVTRCILREAERHSGLIALPNNADNYSRTAADKSIRRALLLSRRIQSMSRSDRCYTAADEGPSKKSHDFDDMYDPPDSRRNLFGDMENEDQVHELLRCLHSKERMIVYLTYWHHLTLKELSFLFEVSRTRIEQIRTRALAKLKRHAGVELKDREKRLLKSK